jgi:hypothetical protein
VYSRLHLPTSSTLPSRVCLRPSRLSRFHRGTAPSVAVDVHVLLPLPAWGTGPMCTYQMYTTVFTPSLLGRMCPPAPVLCTDPSAALTVLGTTAKTALRERWSHPRVPSQAAKPGLPLHATAASSFAIYAPVHAGVFPAASGTAFQAADPCPDSCSLPLSPVQGRESW